MGWTELKHWWWQLSKTFQTETGPAFGYVLEVLKPFCVIFGCKMLSLAQCLKEETISLYACEYLSIALLQFVPESGYFDFQEYIGHLLHLVYKMYHFWCCWLNWSLCINPTITKGSISIPSPTPSSQVLLFSVGSFFVKDHLLIYDNSVSAPDTIWPSISFWFDMLGVKC